MHDKFGDGFCTVSVSHNLLWCPRWDTYEHLHYAHVSVKLTPASSIYAMEANTGKKIKKGNCDIGNYRNSDFTPFNSEKKKSVRYKIRIPRYKLRIARYKLIILRSWIWEKNVQLKKKIRSKMWDTKKERKKSQLPLSHGRYKLPYYSTWQPRRNVHKQFGAGKNDSLYFAIQK